MVTPLYGWDPEGEDHQRGVHERQVDRGELPGTARRDGATGTCVSLVTVMLVTFRYRYVNIA